MMSLAELLLPITLSEPPTPLGESQQRFHAWLATRGNAELASWNETFARIAVRGGYRNALFAATCPTIAEVLAVPHDASRAARIRSLFLGASAVLHDREDLWLATCGASPKTMSVVFESHQDERDLWPTSPSLADFVLQQYGEDSYLAKDVVLPADIAALPVRQGGAPLPRAFDPAVLSRRLH